MFRALALTYLAITCALAPLQDSATEGQEFEARVQELRGLGLDDLVARVTPNSLGTRDPWVDGELARRLHEGTTLTDEQWRKALKGSRTLSTRERWPVSEPLAVCMEYPGWLDPGSIRAVPHVEGFGEASVFRTATISCGNCAMSQSASERNQVLGSLPLGRHVLEFDVSIARRTGRRTEPIWNGTLELIVDVVGTLDEVMPPIHGPELDAGVRDALYAWIAVDEAEDELLPPTITLGVSCDEIDLERFPALSATAVSPEILILRDGVAQGAGCVVPDRTYLPVQIGSNLEDDPKECSRWSVRVRGVGQDVLAIWSARSRWDGSFELPLAMLLTRKTPAADGR